MQDDLNFKRAEYTSNPEILPPVPEYIRANPSDQGAFAKAIACGVAAAVVGSILYAGFTIVTHIVIGYVALGVGYLVGKAMMYGSGNRGGRNYQIAAAVLTYLSVSIASVLEIIWSFHRSNPDTTIGFSPNFIPFLLKYTFASPILALSNGFSGIIGLFILFIAIRAAWRLTSANANTAHHPFAAS
jgi:hypothetical protein